MRWMNFGVSAVLMAALAVSAAAQGNGKPGAWDKARQAAKDKEAQENDRDYKDRDYNDRDRDDRYHNGKYKGPIVFSDRDRDIIRDYFRRDTSKLPPGLAKRNGNLPPGLQKHLEKNGQLPPGLQKRLTPFPSDLERRLPRLPDIYRRGSIGTDVVIVDRKTQRVMDVIRDVLRP